LEETMHRFEFKLATAVVLTAATTLISAHAQAATLPAPDGLRAAIDSLAVTEQTQYRYGGREYCWSDGGWKGPGWYWCGYESRRGLGWGGGRGWRSWSHPSWGGGGEVRREIRREIRREDRRDDRRRDRRDDRRDDRRN
jgi:hypothetical protein